MKDAGHLVPKDVYDSIVEEVRDESKQTVMVTTPSYGLVFNGSNACVGYPDRFSLVFKIKLASSRFAVTLYEIEGQMSVTLDACNSQLILNYGGSSCPFTTISLSLKTDLEAGVWHKIGLSFSDDHLSLFVNCILVEWRDLPGCRITCHEDTTIGILSPNLQTSCSSFGEVMVIIYTAIEATFLHNIFVRLP